MKQAFIKGQRVYEYVADDGTVYWSFTKHKQTTSPPKRLILQSRVGKHITNFLVELRQRADALRRLEEIDAG
jgi:hypothetical protein